VTGTEPFEIALCDGVAELFIASDFFWLLLFPVRRLLAVLFVFNDRNDLVVAPVFGEHPRGSSGAVWIDAFPSAGTVLHQEPHHLERAVPDGKVNGAVLVTVGHRHISQLGAGL
jgi:hypothetical protein